MNAIRIALNAGSIVCVAILGWLIVRIGLGVAQPESLYEPSPIIAPAAAVSTGVSVVSHDFSSDPFAFGQVVSLPLDILDDAPETTLDLKLKGIVSESNATFKLPDGQDKAVKLGEEVMNGVTLTRTAKDFVTLDVNGETQKLTLERVKLGEKETKAKILRAIPATSAQSNMPTRDDIENLFSQVQLTPSLTIMPDKTTQMQGFRINARSGADLSKFKLKSGDVLTRVGPIMLNSNKTNIKELTELVSTGAAQDYEVIRNGAAVTIRIGQ